MKIIGKDGDGKIGLVFELWEYVLVARLIEWSIQKTNEHNTLAIEQFEKTISIDKKDIEQTSKNFINPDEIL